MIELPHMTGFRRETDCIILSSSKQSARSCGSRILFRKAVALAAVGLVLFSAIIAS
jgi:hypothetical protein